MFIHKYACANPIECRRADMKMRKFWFKWNRNWEAKYIFASYLGCKYNDDYYIWRW